MAPTTFTKIAVKLSAVILSLCWDGAYSYQARGQEKVALKDIKISGNLRVEDDGIRLHLKSRPGDPFDPATVEQDVKAIYRMG